MLDKLLEPIFKPFEWLRSTIFGIKQTPAQLKGELSRVQGSVAQVKGDFQGFKADAQGVKPKKMGLFGGKKKCPGCGQKLHATWEECPYCGWGKAQQPVAAPAAPSGGKQRTVALDLGAGQAPGTGMVSWLVPLEGKQTGELFTIKRRASLGSATDNDIVLVDAPSISGHHCEFVAGANGFKVNDLGSTNGTFVNDKRVTSQELIDNDSLRLGHVNFKFKSLV